MRPGGGKEKGSNFEREIAALLSLWISNNERNDLFRRTVLSGGQYTQGIGKRGEPGDLGPNHPLAFAFIDKFVVECKTWAYLELIDVVWGKHALYDAMMKVKQEAESSLKSWMLIAKQNRRPTLVFFPVEAVFYFSADVFLTEQWHTLFNGSVYMFRLNDLVKYPIRLEP